MSDTTLRVRSVTEIVDAAFSLYTRHLVQYVMLAALAAAPSMIVSIFVAPAEFGQQASFAGTMVSLALAFIGSFIVTATITTFGSQVYLGEHEDVGGAIRHAIRRLPAMIGAALLTALLYIVGALCFLVGVFYVMARYFAVAPAVVLENKGPLAALKRSSQLSRDRIWHILKALLLVYGIYFVLQIGVSVVTVFARDNILQVLLQWALSALVTPVIGLSTMLLYYDARIRGEGFDIERMSQQLDTAVS